MGRRFFLPLLLLVAFLISATSAEAGLRLALQMLAGSVFFRRVSGQMSDPGWAERAPQQTTRHAAQTTRTRLATLSGMHRRAPNWGYAQSSP